MTTKLGKENDATPFLLVYRDFGGFSFHNFL